MFLTPFSDINSRRRMPVTLSRPTGQTLARLVDRLPTLTLTYPEVGATRQTELPPGYRHDRYSVVIGGDEAAFQRGQEALRRWQAHRGARATVIPAGAALAVGTKVVVTVRFGPAFVLAPCEIVYVTDTSDRFGFAYGTLPGHPERGEEAFHVQRSAEGEVSFDVVAFSRPASAWARLGGPVARVVQARVTRAYLEGVRRYVAAGQSSGLD